MRLMHSCRHSQAPCSSLSLIIITIIIIPPSLPLFLSLPYTLLHFFPWSEFRSATALTHTHDETEWDTIWLRLTHTLGIEVFACACAHKHTVGLPLMMMYAHTHNSRHMPPPSLYHHRSLQITVAHIHSVYLWLHQCSTWCKTPYIGIPAQELWLKQPPVYSQPPFRKIREGRAGERGETKKEWGGAKIRGTVKRDVGLTDVKERMEHNQSHTKKLQKNIHGKAIFCRSE